METRLGRLRLITRYAAILAAAIAAAFAPGAASAGSLDQSQVEFGSAKGFIGTLDDPMGSPVLQSQSFTSGLTGNLDRVDLPVRVVGDPGVALTAQIRTVVDGTPSDVVLASAIVPESTLPVFAGPESDFTTFSFEPIVFTSPAFVANGATYAIVLLAPGATPTISTPNRYEWAGVSADPYAGGTHHSGIGSTWLSDASPVDLAFKTYIASSAATVQFLQPLDQSNDPSNPILNTGKNGRVIPVKVTIMNGTAPVTGTDMPTPVVTLNVSKLDSCSTTAGSDPIESFADAGSSSSGTNLLRWNALAGEWDYNLDTKTLGLIVGNCYRIDIFLDGSPLSNAFAVYQPTK
jgi:hypothetical protein